MATFILRGTEALDYARRTGDPLFYHGFPVSLPEASSAPAHVRHMLRVVADDRLLLIHHLGGDPETAMGRRAIADKWSGWGGCRLMGDFERFASVQVDARDTGSVRKGQLARLLGCALIDHALDDIRGRLAKRPAPGGQAADGSKQAGDHVMVLLRADHNSSHYMVCGSATTMCGLPMPAMPAGYYPLENEGPPWMECEACASVMDGLTAKGGGK